MMRRISLGLLAATAMGVIASQGASAADMRMPVKAPAPLPPPVQDWSGIYSGIEGGFGWGKNNFEQNFNQFDTGAASIFDILNGTSTTGAVFPAFTGPGIGNIDTSGWLFG